MKILIFAILVFCVAPMSFSQASGQVEPVCISQEAANKCRDLAKENPALENKIKVLEQALKDKDAAHEKAIEKILKVLKDTEIKLATKTGELIKAENTNNDLLEILKAVLPRMRKKCNGLVLFC